MSSTSSKAAQQRHTLHYNQNGPIQKHSSHFIKDLYKKKEKIDEDWGHGFTPFKSRAFPQNGSTYAVAVGKSLISAMKAWFNTIIINHA